MYKPFKNGRRPSCALWSHKLTPTWPSHHKALCVWDGDKTKILIEFLPTIRPACSKVEATSGFLLLLKEISC